MKKLFVLMAAAFAMVACQTDINEVGVATDGVATVEFEVGAPQMRAYTYSLGQLATNLKYAVYDADGKILSDLTVTDAEINGKANVKIELANNKSYSIIFWAEADNAPYTVDFTNKTVAVNYNGAVCNDESRDAFYAYLPFEVKGAATLSVELRRPFAQVNVGASDLAAALKSGFKPVQSALKVKNVFSTLKLVDGTATDNVAEVTFGTANIPAADETFPVANHAYMAMSYVLVGKDKGSYDVTYTITAEDNTVINNTIGAVPMQANYRTNIYGKLLTSTTDINVEIKPGYDGEHGSEVLAPDYGVKTAEELVALVNNATEDIIIELSNDIAGSITLNKSTNPNVDVTILGNNKTFAGKIHIWGAGGATSTMTIKDVNLVVDGSYTDDEACIYTLGNINGTNSYARNVTIDGCTFSGTGETVAAIRHAVGGTNDWTIKNCTVNAGMHSFLQIANVNSGLVVENCKVYSKNGANLNSTCKASFTGCEFDVQGYAVRVGASKVQNQNETKVFNFTKCTLKSANDDGDAVVIIRPDAEKATLNFEDTTLVGDPQISGAVAGTTTIYMDGELYVPGGYYEQNNVISVFTTEGLVNAIENMDLTDSTPESIVLEGDIDLSELAPSSRALVSNWKPIGTSKNPFTGTFDGKGHTIKNLVYVTEDDDFYVGFFGYAKNATIKNVTFENVNIKVGANGLGGNHIAAVAGVLCSDNVGSAGAKKSYVENVTVQGDIYIESDVTSTNSSRVAVVVGGNDDSDVVLKDVHVIANEGSYVKANSFAGGIVGQTNRRASFENCNSNINVTATRFFAGGIAGSPGNEVSFVNCHSTGDITVTAGRSGAAHDHYRVGGIAGGWDDNIYFPLVLTNCSYTGKLSGTNADGTVAEKFDYLGYVGRGYSVKNGSKVVIDGVEFVQTGPGVYEVTEN